MDNDLCACTLHGEWIGIHRKRHCPRSTPVVPHPVVGGALNPGCRGQGPFEGVKQRTIRSEGASGGQPPEDTPGRWGTEVERKGDHRAMPARNENGQHDVDTASEDRCGRSSNPDRGEHCESVISGGSDDHLNTSSTLPYPTIPYRPEVLSYEAELFEVLGSVEEESLSIGSDSNMFAALSDLPDEGCTRSRSLSAKAKTLVRWYRQFGLTPCRNAPGEVTCGNLRKAVRDCFSDLDAIWELSFKTIAKIEKDCCSYCLPSFEKRLDVWKSARFDPVSVDTDHLNRFKECLAGNVEKGWDRFRRPFIPNGHATREHGRKTGGNWNVEEFSEYCTPVLVFSSGKPRVVTKYSSRNTSVLGELHYSLYHCLKQKGWLLVGDPTDQHVQRLGGADLLSFDYSSATDNIKAAYVQAAVEVLKDRADCLSLEEIRSLDVLANLKIDGCPGIATRGQPMGSVMSFPLLCLINKSVVDLALRRMIEGKEISFAEWSSHRCLINGDDLLTREVRSNTNLRGLISEEGSKVGLVVNQEKTMSSPCLAEINSTLFSDGIKQRKFNASAVWMDSEVEDVLGFASQACPDVRSFRKVVVQNAWILAKQSDKKLDLLPRSLQRVCAKTPKIRRALLSLPDSVKRSEQGPIRMEPVPQDYNLSSDEEHLAMREEIERVRDRAIAFFSRPARPFTTSVSSNACSYRSVRKRKRIGGQEVLPACYIRWFQKKKWKALEEPGLASGSVSAPVLDESKANYLIGLLRSRKREIAVQTPMTGSLDFVSFGCSQQPSPEGKSP